MTVPRPLGSQKPAPLRIGSLGLILERLLLVIQKEGLRSDSPSSERHHWAKGSSSTALEGSCRQAGVEALEWRSPRDHRSRLFRKITAPWTADTAAGPRPAVSVYLPPPSCPATCPVDCHADSEAQKHLGACSRLRGKEDQESSDSGVEDLTRRRRKGCMDSAGASRGDSAELLNSQG